MIFTFTNKNNPSIFEISDDCQKSMFFAEMLICRLSWIISLAKRFCIMALLRWQKMEFFSSLNGAIIASNFVHFYPQNHIFRAIV